MIADPQAVSAVAVHQKQVLALAAHQNVGGRDTRLELHHIGLRRTFPVVVVIADRVLPPARRKHIEIGPLVAGQKVIPRPAPQRVIPLAAIKRVRPRQTRQ